MNEDTLEQLSIIAVLCLVIGFVFGLGAGFITAEHGVQRDAVYLGFAHYNPTNTDFTWNTNLLNPER